MVENTRLVEPSQDYGGLAAPRPGILLRLFARALAHAFDIGIRCSYRLEVRGMDNYSRSPRTLIVANHRRDSDGPILGALLWGGNWQDLPHFVAREDLLRRGFLRDYLNGPRVLRELLSPLSLATLLLHMGTCPMRRIPERTLGEVLGDVLEQQGDLPLEAVLKRSWVHRFQELGRGQPPLHLSDVLRRQYRPLLAQTHGLRRLSLERFRELKPHHRAIIRAQLQDLVERLNGGATLILEPEGRVSVSGEYTRPRAALHTLINGPDRSPHVVPVGITYDFVTTGRPTVFANIGPQQTGLRGLSRKETDTRIAQMLCAQSTVTASQLVSRMIRTARDSSGAFTVDQLTQFVTTEANHCAARGLYVDPRLRNPDGRRARVHECLNWYLRSGPLQRWHGGHFRVTEKPSGTVCCWSDPWGAVDYLDNEFAALLRFNSRDMASEPA